MRNCGKNDTIPRIFHDISLRVSHACRPRFLLSAAGGLRRAAFLRATFAQTARAAAGHAAEAAVRRRGRTLSESAFVLRAGLPEPADRLRRARSERRCHSGCAGAAEG